MLVIQIHHQLIKTNATLALAESCTGGGIASRFVAIPDCSFYFQGGVVAYSNRAKETLLGVKSSALENFGAVSEQVALEMATGAQHVLKADIALSTTGIAGPSGATAHKPVGTVCFALTSIHREPLIWTTHFKGERIEVIQKAIDEALVHLWSYIA